MQIKPANEIKVNDVVNVTGLSVYNYSNVSSNIGINTIVRLRRDPTNKYDVNATGVFFNGNQIGWIPKSSNSDFAKHLSLTDFIYARVIAHDRNASDISKRLFIQVTDHNIINRAIFTDTEKTGVEKLKNLIKQPKEENKMNKLVNDTIARNSNNATSAAFLEAGRIANRQATKLASKHLPMMVRGYADTAGGRLVLANIAATAAAQFRPGDRRLARLADAMMVTAYQEVLQSFDIEKMIEDMLSNETIKAALSKVSEDNDAIV